MRIAVEIFSRLGKSEKVTPIAITSLWSKSTGLWSSLAQVTALSAVLQIAAFAAPFQIQLVVDEAIGHSDQSLLSVLALGFGALLVIQAALEALRNWALQILGNTLTYQMVGNLFRHLIRLPSDFFEKRHVGDILSRMGSTSAIQDALTKGIISALIDGVMALIAAIILVLYSPILAAVVIGSVALSLITAMAFFPATQARSQEQLIASATERSHLMESVRAATTIKVMGREGERESYWRNLYASFVNATVSLARLQISAIFIQTTIMGLSSVLVIYLGAQTVLAGSGMSIGMLLAFLAFRQTFTDRALSLINQSIQFRLLGLHLDRLADVIATEPDTPAVALPDIEVGGHIVFQGVSFRYGPSDPWVLKDLDLEVAAGEFLSITGPSGRGKTTLMKLMLGLRSPTEGQILLDGRPATPELWRVWRTHVGVVAQDDRLLSGTIADNIAFFDPDLDMVAVRAAAEAAQIHPEIERMPMQYLSLVGDMGSTLSGGQRQRVLLARALYRRPSVLFLDEGTANLDPDTETMIAELLAGLPITRVIVAHRPALVARSDRIFTL
ncbi:peptidase domain-containing ABC transporter [Caulobacter sp. NIBR1757]|uniref:peptidase domain-containing ABC transporter n=1 Tax=Caulobacter sp. NIBR1757 TaxID=3016000 RepID=UPI0032AF4654